MSDTWITDIRHFLHNDESIPDLPGPAAQVAKYIGSIIEAVTCRDPDSDDLSTDIRCRRRPGHKRCEGKIVAFYDEDDPTTIRWFCPICGDNGYIIGWQKTRLDRTLYR
ncbi:MAG: hypothetical protein R6U43_06030 [Candidatus Krumholzibacteriales bacterium]